MNLYQLTLTEAALQHYVNLLQTRPHGEVRDLIDDVAAQVQKQDADRALAARQAIEDEVRAADAAARISKMPGCRCVPVGRK